MVVLCSTSLLPIVATIIPPVSAADYGSISEPLTAYDKSDFHFPPSLAAATAQLLKVD